MLIGSLNGYLCNNLPFLFWSIHFFLELLHYLFLHFLQVFLPVFFLFLFSIIIFFPTQFFSFMIIPSFFSFSLFKCYHNENYTCSKRVRWQSQNWCFAKGVKHEGSFWPFFNREPKSQHFETWGSNVRLSLILTV